MRVLIAILALIVSANATSLKDFNAKTPAERSAFVASYIDKMTTDLRPKNEQLATDIRNFHVLFQVLSYRGVAPR